MGCASSTVLRRPPRKVELQGFEGTRANLNGKIAFCGPLDPLKQKYPVTIDGSSVLCPPSPGASRVLPGAARLFPTDMFNRAASARRLGVMKLATALTCSPTIMGAFVLPCSLADVRAQRAQEPIFVAACHLKDPSQVDDTHGHPRRGRIVAAGERPVVRRSPSPERAADTNADTACFQAEERQAEERSTVRTEEEPTFQSCSLHLMMMNNSNRASSRTSSSTSSTTFRARGSPTWDQSKAETMNASPHSPPSGPNRKQKDSSELKKTHKKTPEEEHAEMMRLYRESLQMGCVVETHFDRSNSGGNANSGGSNRCVRCKSLLTGGSLVDLGAVGRVHKKCFTCVACSAHLGGVLWKGDWMQPGSTRVPRSEGIYCLGCHNAQFGPNCSGCGRKLLDKVFSIKGTIFMYCSEVCRDEDKMRELDEEERKKGDVERRKKTAAVEEEERKWTAHQAAAAAEEKKRRHAAAVAAAAAEKERQEQESAASAAKKKTRQDELDAEAKRTAHEAWAQGLATIEKAEQEGHQISSYHNHHVLQM